MYNKNDNLIKEVGPQAIMDYDDTKNDTNIIVKDKKDNNNKIKNEVILKKKIIQKIIDIPKNTDEEKKYLIPHKNYYK